MDDWGTELTDYQKSIQRKERLEKEKRDEKVAQTIGNASGDVLGYFLYFPIALILFLFPLWRNRCSGIYQGFIFGCLLSNWLQEGIFPTYWYIIPILSILYVLIAYKYHHPNYLKTFIISFLIPILFFDQVIALKDWIVWQLTLAIRSIPHYLPKTIKLI